MTPQEAHSEAWKLGYLPMWTVYDRPREYPEGFIARMHIVSLGEWHAGTTAAVRGKTLEEVRDQIPPGLSCLARDPTDDPKIVEVWL